jgi:sugar-specific transcriptional regulator TrmB
LEDNREATDVEALIEDTERRFEEAQQRLEEQFQELESREAETGPAIEPDASDVGASDMSELDASEDSQAVNRNREE